MPRRKLRQLPRRHHQELPNSLAENELSPSHAMHSLALSTKLVRWHLSKTQPYPPLYLCRAYSQRRRLANCIICRYISMHHPLRQLNVIDVSVSSPAAICLFLCSILRMIPSIRCDPVHHSASILSSLWHLKSELEMALQAKPTIIA